MVADLFVLYILELFCTVVNCTRYTLCSDMILICCDAGKILEDSKVISDYKIEEKNFVVVMVTKVWDQIVAEFYR